MSYIHKEPAICSAALLAKYLSSLLGTSCLHIDQRTQWNVPMCDEHKWPVNRLKTRDVKNTVQCISLCKQRSFDAFDLNCVIQFAEFKSKSMKKSFGTGGVFSCVRQILLQSFQSHFCDAVCLHCKMNKQLALCYENNNAKGCISYIFQRGWRKITTGQMGYQDPCCLKHRSLS